VASGLSLRDHGRDGPGCAGGVDAGAARVAEGLPTGLCGDQRGVGVERELCAASAPSSTTGNVAHHEAADEMPFTRGPSGLGGERCVGRPRPPIPHIAETREAEQHHGPWPLCMAAPARSTFWPMVHISISQAAFEAVASTLPVGMGYEAEPNEHGERLIWLEATMVNRLGAMRGLGESYSDVILRIAAEKARA
jgi:hypothetical protein